MISTQVNPDTKVALPGVRPASKTDALCLLDPAYAGKQGRDVFNDLALRRSSNGPRPGLWGVVLYKDRGLHPHTPERAAAIVAYYKPWLPPWKRS